MAFLGPLLSKVGESVITGTKKFGKVAEEHVEQKVNKKFGTHLGTSKPAPTMTAMSNVAPAPGLSPRRSSSRSDAASEYHGVGAPGPLDN
jgi:hypothetical protein